MKAEKNKVVAVSYELEVEGQIADKAGSEKPLEYIHGSGMLLPKFEENVEGKEPGEGFEFVLTPEEGYGAYQPEYVIELPMESFAGPDGNIMTQFLVVGTVIPMLDNQGQVVQGTVAEVGKETVKMDFNHPMAGKTLHFTGKVETVRDATEKELLEGLHGEYLPKEGCHCHGGCHGGECGGDCEGDCEGKCGEGECGGDCCGK